MSGNGGRIILHRAVSLQPSNLIRASDIDKPPPPTCGAISALVMGKAAHLIADKTSPLATSSTGQKLNNLTSAAFSHSIAPPHTAT